MNDALRTLSVDPERGLTLAHQLKQQITWLVASGRLKTGDRLPPIRELAAHLSINLHTVRSAYRMLETEGLVETRRGRGTHVLAFDPGRTASVAKLPRSHTVGIILPSFANPFYHALLQGVEEMADEDQTLLLVGNTQDDPAEAWRYFAQMASKQVDGILVVSHNTGNRMLASLAESPESPKLPFVTVDWPQSAGYSVMIDLEGAGYQGAQHLLQHGHRRIGLITYALDVANVRPVNAGYERALQEAGIQNDPGLVARVSAFGSAAGAEGARKLIELPQPPSALFAITDLMAVGAMQVVKAAGLRIPQDIALVGFNDIPLAALVDPPLTTVAAPAYEMGQAAMKMLQSLIAGRRPARRRVVLPTALVVRQSCGLHT